MNPFTGTFHNEEEKKSYDFTAEACYKISNLKPGERITYDERKFAKGWEYNFNPNNHETPKSVMDKWLKFIWDNLKVRHWIDFANYRIYFHRVKEDNK